MLKIPFIYRTLLRDWQSNELTLLALSLIISMMCVTAINNFSALVYQQLNMQSSGLLGADTILTSSATIPTNWQQQAQNFQLKQTITLSFLSMVENNNHLQLAQIKGVKAGYPLYGRLKVASFSGEKAFYTQAPPKIGTIWVSQRLLTLLNLNIGDNITIGSSVFSIAYVLLEEPGQAGDWFNLAPRIMMNLDDVAKTGAVQPGSNISYRWLLSGPLTKIDQFKQALKPMLTEHQTWLAPNTANKASTNTLENTLIFINIGTLMSLILAGGAISLASVRYINRRQQQVAVLRCFGLSQRAIFKVYFISILTLGIISSLIGIALGYLLQPLLIYWLGNLFFKIEHLFFIKSFFLSLFTGISVLFCFTLPHLFNLRKISPIHLFRTEMNSSNTVKEYLYAFFLLAFLSYLYTYSWKLIFILIVVCGGFIFFTLCFLMLSLKFIKLIQPYFSIPWRFGFTNIQRNLANSTLQIISIGLALTALLTLSLLKTNLLTDWRKQLPTNAPNYFIINIQPEQVQAVTNFLTNNSLTLSQSYPMVRGRISTINYQDVNTVLGNKVETINALQRELNFSWTNQLPTENQLIAGKWDIHNTKPWISIEKELAHKMGVGVGDTLGIRLGDKLLNVQIANIRAVHWMNLHPNFFILFKPGVIDNLPKTFIMSFYLPIQQQAVLVDLIQQFPNITLIDVAETVKKIQDILNSAGKAISLIALFSLLSGLIIVLLAMLSFYDLKQKETFLLKLLGMRKHALLWVRGSESFIIGFFAGLLATLTAFVINYYVNVFILKLSITIPWLLFFSMPFVCAGSMLILNYWIFLRQYELRQM